MAIIKFQTNTIAKIAAYWIGQAVILVIIHFIDNIISQVAPKTDVLATNNFIIP